MFGFVKRFSNRGLVHKCGFFIEKTTYFVVVNKVEEMNNEISRKTKICVRYQETKERSRAEEKKVPLHGLNIINANVHRTKQTLQRHTTC